MAAATANASNFDKKVVLKNCAVFIDCNCISKIPYTNR